MLLNPFEGKHPDRDESLFPMGVPDLLSPYREEPSQISIQDSRIDRSEGVPSHHDDVEKSRVDDAEEPIPDKAESPDIEVGEAEIFEERKKPGSEDELDAKLIQSPGPIEVPTDYKNSLLNIPGQEEGQQQRKHDEETGSKIQTSIEKIEPKTLPEQVSEGALSQRNDIFKDFPNSGYNGNEIEPEVEEQKEDEGGNMPNPSDFIDHSEDYGSHYDNGSLEEESQQTQNEESDDSQKYDNEHWDGESQQPSNDSHREPHQKGRRTRDKHKKEPPNLHDYLLPRAQDQVTFSTLSVVCSRVAARHGVLR